MPRRFPVIAVFAAVLSPVPGTAVASPASNLKHELSKAMSGASSSSGAFVMDAASGRTMFSRRGTTPRILASNTKLFTSAAVLGRYGRGSSLATELIGAGSLQPDGTWKGSLYLRGGGDPTFGSRSFARSTFGSNASVEALADRLDKAGFKSVTGAVIGDESSFDSLRGGPSSSYGISQYVGPLSALSFDRGVASGGWQRNPPLVAATSLRDALKARGIKVRGSARTGTTPDGSVELAEVRSPDVAHLLLLQNKPSDNYIAEMLVKGLPMAASTGGSLRTSADPVPGTPTPDSPTAQKAALSAKRGTTKGGAAAAMEYAHSLGVSVRMVDGSGLSRSDRAAPKQIVRLLRALRRRAGFSSFYASLPVAGRDGTLASRMRSGPAYGRCHAKTGTLSDVSALSGYCVTRSGRTLIFSVLNNRTSISGAHVVQDRVAQLLAGYRG